MSKKFIAKYLPEPQKIKNIKSLKFLGDSIYSPNLWHLNRHSVSRAVAIGLWAMYTPPLPWQQVIAATGAIYFNANLPLAVALVWITNPLTWAPFYYVAYKVGAYTLGLPSFNFSNFLEIFNVDKILELGTPLLVGCFILMNVGAVIGYFGVQYLWRQAIRRRIKIRKQRRLIT